jgi:CDGSH-type Zn-finger protein/uncharacterized Fe-S cluster protein YjdI
MSDKLHVYRGAGVVVRYDAGVCTHAAECVRGLPAVFNTRKVPWVQPDHASVEEVLAVVARCPSGALSAERVEAAPAPAAVASGPAANTAKLAVNGPLLLAGDILVVDADGNELKRAPKVALCRCGASANKPFCDGSHKGCGFLDEGKAGAIAIKHDPALGEGPHLTVQIRPRGPAIVTGPIAILDAEGQELCHGNRAALCRCGASANRPLCDGSHNRIGFEAPAEVG